MACQFPVAVKAKLMLTAIHCLLYFAYTRTYFLAITCQPLFPCCVYLMMMMMMMMMMVFQVDNLSEKPSAKRGGWGTDAEYETTQLYKFIFI